MTSLVGNIYVNKLYVAVNMASRRASVNILQSGVRTSMVLNLDVRYVLAIKSDVTLHTGRKKTILAVCITTHYTGHTPQP